jgi:hypothetical protein
MTRRRLQPRLFFILLTFISVMSLSSTVPLWAAGQEFSFRGHDLIVAVDTRWAGSAQGGYYPIRIRVVNRGPSRNLTFRLMSAENTLPAVARTIGAQQNATAQFTLSVPMVGRGNYGTLRVFQDGRPLSSLERAIHLPEVVDANLERPALLVISPRNVDCSEFEQAANAIVTARGASHRYGYTRTEDHQVVPPTLLPDSWIDYSGLDIVAIPLEVLGSIPSESRAAILKWVQCGGTLLVYNTEDPTAQSPELSRLLGLGQHSFVSQEWQPANPTQRRMISLTETDGLVHGGGVGLVPGMGGPDEAEQPAGLRGFVWEGRPDTFVRRQLMLGQVYAFHGDPFPGSVHDWAWFLASVTPERFQWTTRQGLSSRQVHGEFLHFLIPGIRGVPIFSFLVLITVFTLIIGPLNYFVLWRKKHLHLLVLTIPLFAFVTSLSLFGYSAVSHGFDVKSRIRSLTVLDQRSRNAVQISRVALYAGFAPSRGLRFSPETAVYNIWADGQQFNTGRVDWTETQALESGWLRSRTRTQLVTVTNRAERGRLEVGPPTGDTLEVSNGLEWNIESLAVLTDAGDWYFGADIPAGASAHLTKGEREERLAVASILDLHPLELPDEITEGATGGLFRNDWAHGRRYHPGSVSAIPFSDSLMEREIQRIRERSDDRMRNRSYYAVLKQNPHLDVGIEHTVEHAGLHVLMGYY